MAVTSDGAGALRPTILVVEDDGAVRNLIQTTLDAGGFAHVSESTGRGAIAAAAMSVSSVCVVTNALRLRGWKPQRVSATPVGAAGKAASGPASANEAAGVGVVAGAVTSKEANNLPSANETANDAPSSDGMTTDPNAFAVNSRSAALRFPERHLRVEGMKCHKCAGRVRGALEAVPGVESAVVDLEGKQATVHLIDSVPDEVLVGAVIEKGFEAEMLPYRQNGGCLSIK